MNIISAIENNIIPILLSTAFKFPDVWVIKQEIHVSWVVLSMSKLFDDFDLI